jgi:hypothetical protein
MSPVYENTIRTQPVYRPWTNIAIKDNCFYTRLEISSPPHYKTTPAQLNIHHPSNQFSLYPLFSSTTTNGKLGPTLRSRAPSSYSTHRTYLETTLLHLLQALQTLRFRRLIYQWLRRGRRLRQPHLVGYTRSRRRRSDHTLQEVSP